MVRGKDSAGKRGGGDGGSVRVRGNATLLSERQGKKEATDVRGNGWQGKEAGTVKYLSKRLKCKVSADTRQER
jgi:hypothetical protein